MDTEDEGEGCRPGARWHGAEGGSAFRGLRESSEMPPFPLPLRVGPGGVAAAGFPLLFPGLWVLV